MNDFLSGFELPLPLIISDRVYQASIPYVVKRWTLSLLTILLCGILPVAAQDLKWSKSMGGLKYDYAYGICLDKQGNVYSTGYFGGTSDFDPGTGVAELVANASGYGVPVSKLDASGNFVWAKLLSGTSTIIGTGIKTDGAGNVYIIGRFQGAADFDPGTGVASVTSNGKSDFFICKLNSSGNFVWVKTVGGPESDQALSITIDNSDNIYISGYFQGTVDFDPGIATTNLISKGSLDAFVCKFSAAGSLLWAKSMGGPEAEEAVAIALDATGNVYTSGYYGGTADFDPGTAAVNLTASGGKDVFICKLDASGGFLWAKGIGSSNDEEGTAIIVHPNGKVTITGYFEGTVDFDPSTATTNLKSAGGWDAFICQFDATGNLVWAKNVGGDSYDKGLALASDQDNNVYITGTYSDKGDFNPGTPVYTLTGVGSADIFLCVLNAKGEFKWARSIGGDNDDEANAMVIESNQIFLTGNYSGTVDFNPGTAVNDLISQSGDPDIFVLKLGFEPCVTNSSSKEVSACSSYKINDLTFDKSGRYVVDTLTNINGCDSLLYIELTIMDPNSSSNAIASCDSFLFKGKLYGTGTYIDTLKNEAGCDSVHTINFTYTPLDVSVVQTDATLKAVADGVTYQWINCDEENTPIADALQQSYVATKDGNYGVIITKEECVDTSRCYAVKALAIPDIANAAAIQFMPNPATSIVYITTEQPLQLQFFSLDGRLVKQEMVSNHHTSVNISALLPGMYLIHVLTTDHKTIKVQKFLKF